MARPGFRLRLRERELLLGERTLVMGILNVTPDSFSDGGQFLALDHAIAHARKMGSDGADIIDIGAESTRPGAQAVGEAEELERLLPVLEGVRQETTVPISVDTYKPGVAEGAVAAGAALINFPAFSPIEEMARVALSAGVPLIAMHVRGTPEDMHRLLPLDDVVTEVLAGLRRLRDRAVAAGLPREALVLDPGFGFGKNGDQNYELLARFDRFHELGCPLLAGTSRKSFIGRTLDAPAIAPSASEVHPRAWGTAATVAAAVLAGVHIVRVHDVAEMSQVARAADQILNARRPLPC